MILDDDRSASDIGAREKLLDAAFGPGRAEKTCERLREGRQPAAGLSIVEILAKNDGIQIARRTVAKYREMLGILASSKRKKLF